MTHDTWPLPAVIEDGYYDGLACDDVMADMAASVYCPGPPDP